MSTPHRMTFACLFAALACSLPTATLAEEIHAGIAEVDITPPDGYRMSGYFRERLSTGTHDPLLAKAIYLHQGETEAALVFCDLIGVPLAVSQGARKQASAATELPAQNILIAATHSHTGPLYYGSLREHFHFQAIVAEGKDKAESVNFADQLREKLAQAIQTAKENARPVTLAAGYAEQQGLSFNRRFHMKDGTVRFNPGKLNPDIVRVAGPIDPEVGLLLLRDAEGEMPLACLTTFALHLDTVGGTEYAADFPYYLAQSLQKQYGESFTSLFAAGTCGDINHIDVSHDRPQKGHEEAERIGAALGETVIARLKELPLIGEPQLAVRSATIDVPLQTFSEDEVANARRDMNKIGTRDLSFLDQVKTNKIVDVALRESETLSLDVQVFRLSSDVALVGLPGEVFVDLGLAIKSASPFKTTIVMELCNDAPAYIPTKKAFAEGSYETINTRIAPGGGERMVETAIELLKSLEE
mgnify:FL=1